MQASAADHHSDNRKERRTKSRDYTAGGWRIILNRARVMGILLIYVFAANLTLIDRLNFLNDIDMGINLDYWEANTIFIGSVMFWSNMLLYSLLPVWIASNVIKDKIVTYCTYVLPANWGLSVFRHFEDARSEGEVLVPNLKYFMYGLLLVSLLVLLIRIIMIVVALRTEESIDDLEHFKQHALEKVEDMNPYLNQQLLKEVVGRHGESFRLLLAANVEADERKKQLLTRLALIAMDPETGGGDDPADH